jgi:hypothetical protein
MEAPVDGAAYWRTFKAAWELFDGKGQEQECCGRMRYKSCGRFFNFIGVVNRFWEKDLVSYYVAQLGRITVRKKRFLLMPLTRVL